MSESNKTVLVTGSTGFLGSHVVPVLESLGVQVVRHRRFLADESAAFDLAHPPQGAFDLLGRPETIVHLAWGGLPNYSSRHHYEVELQRHYQFLKQMAEAGVRKLVVTGTCFEYGRIEGCLSEEMVPNPDNPYGYAKDALRRQLSFLGNELGFDLIWIRLFYLHGIRQPSRTLFAQLDTAIDRGDAVFPMTAGEQLRDYLAVEDAAASISQLTVEDIGSQVVNVCSGSPCSIRNLVESRIAEKGASIVPLFGALPYSEYEAMAFWGCGRKLQRLIQK